MIATLKDLYTNIVTHFISGKHIIFFISRNCNFRCAHCIQGSKEAINNEILSTETIDRVFAQIWDSSFLISICGGETLLYPELVKYICQKAREKHITTLISSNGFYWNDKNLLNYIKNEIMPNYLRLSIDTFHQKFVSIDNLKKIIQFFNQSQLKIFGGSILNFECETGEIENFNSLGLIYEIMSCVNFGAAEHLKKRERLPTNYIVKCECGGITIDPKGDLFVECEMEIDGCHLGSIYDSDCNLRNLFDKFKGNLPWYKIQANDNVHDIYDYCQKNKDHIFDPKWRSNLMPKQTDQMMTNTYIKSVQEGRNYFKKWYINDCQV
jgi:hypothetical protein